MKSSKSNWVTLLMLFIVVLCIFIKEDAFSKEKENYISSLEIYQKKISLKDGEKEYALHINQINIEKKGMQDELPICTCEITNVKYDKDKYKINTDTEFDYENKKVLVKINITELNNNNILDSYIITITYENEINIDEECTKEYICPIFK